MKKLLIPFLLFLLPLSSFADGNGTLSNTYNFTKCGLNYTTASQRLGQRFNPAGTPQPAPFDIGGIPACATVEAAFLYVEGSGNGAAQTATIVGPTGTQNFPMTLIGSQGDKCWGYQGSYTYRADVTSVVTGNFTYMVSGILTGNPNDMDGATLIVVYSDPMQTYQGTLLIDDGAIERSGGTATHTMNFTAPCGDPTNVKSFMGVGDIQFDGQTIIVNAVTVPYTFNWWNYFEASTVLTQAQTSADYTVIAGGDCYNIAFTGLYYQTTTCTVCQPPTIALTTSSTPTTCGLCNGTATVVATGSPYGYTYLWSNGDTSATATGLCAGTYTVQVTTLCASESAVVEVPIGPGPATITHTQTDPECNAYCDGTATLDISGGSPPYTYSWAPTGGNAATATNLCAGTYIATVVDGIGCINTDTIVITEPAPTPPPIVHDTAFCQFGPSAALVADPSTAGDEVRWWDAPSGGNYTLTPPVPSTDVAGVLTWYVSDVTPIGCESVRVPITATIKDKPLFPGVTPYNYCQYSDVDVVSLVAVGDSIQWYTTEVGGVGTFTPPTPSIDSPGNFIWYVSQTINGCESDRTPQTVVVNPGVIANFGFNIKLGCNRDTLRITDSSIVNGDESVIWDFGDGSPFELFDHNPEHLYYSTGTYPITLYLTNGYCYDTMTKDAYAVVYNVEPLIVSPDVVTICPGDTAELHAFGDSSYTYSWSPEWWIKGEHTANPVIQPQANMIYTATGTDTIGCQHTGTIRVTIASNAVISLPDSIRLFAGETYEMDPQGNCLYFSWFPPTGLSADNIANPIANPEVSTRYIVHGITESGCKATDSIDVFVSPESALYLPNAFAPGSTNPENREFKIIKRGIATLKDFRIYDRWGVMVYDGKDIDKGWDGTYKGKPQPFGVYIYMVEAVTSTGQKFTKQGNVTLLR
ncbi:MAG: hypothetical protein BGO69_06185 [Bacteroidetes bacterium 46-16]|nr:MAG: hypothetical protein BGO69_06185 [Bacteroidetes bacterium 46-16]